MKLAKSILFYLVQFTWGLPQNIVGGIGFLLFLGKCKHERFGYSLVTYVPGKFGGVSLGIFIFMNADKNKKKWRHDTRIHEYGHTFQSLLLGPLYLIVVGVPSFIWCGLPALVKYREKNDVSYYNLYCECWANLWGLKFSGEKFITDNCLERGYWGKPLPEKYR